MTRSRFFATCARGLEPVLADELRALGVADVEAGRGGQRERDVPERDAQLPEAAAEGGVGQDARGPVPLQPGHRGIAKHFPGIWAKGQGTAQFSGRSPLAFQRVEFAQPAVGVENRRRQRPGQPQRLRLAQPRPRHA